MAITVAVAAITEQSNVIIITRGLRDTTAMTSVPIRVWLVVLLVAFLATNWVQVVQLLPALVPLPAHIWVTGWPDKTTGYKLGYVSPALQDTVSVINYTTHCFTIEALASLLFEAEHRFL